MIESIVPIEDFDMMICRICTCEQFKLLALRDGDDTIALVAECDECGHREQIVVGDDCDA